MRPRGRQTVTVLLLVALIGGGVGIGIALDRLWLRPTQTRQRGTSAQRVERLTKLFRKRLALTDVQARAVEAALRRSFARMAAIRAKVRPQREAIRRESRAEITKALTPTQREKYREMVRAYEARRKARR